MSVWQGLAIAADNGALHLSADAARRCDAACIAFLEKLRTQRVNAFHLATVDCYGDFQSGRQLSRLYSERMAGGPNSMVEVLESHIEVVEQMQAVFQKFFVDYDDTDQNNSSSITQAGPN